jgi:hypothetical protein
VTWPRLLARLGAGIGLAAVLALAPLLSAVRIGHSSRAASIDPAIVLRGE